MKLISKYTLVGIWNTVFGILFFIALSSTFDSWSNFSVLFLSYFISIVQSHYTQRVIVWNSSSQYFSEFLKFSSGYAVQFLLNLLLIEIFTTYIDIGRNLVQVFITMFLALTSFFLNKNFVFKA